MHEGARIGTIPWQAGHLACVCLFGTSSASARPITFRKRPMTNQRYALRAFFLATIADETAVPAETIRAKVCWGDRLATVLKNCSSNGAARWKSFISECSEVGDNRMRMYERSEGRKQGVSK